MLKIVDRLKNLVKLKGGEYVAIEFMEATYAQSVFVNGRNGGLMCYADGDMDRPIALVQVSHHEEIPETMHLSP
jgi:long-chain acyl-CoA synthetase